MKGKGMTKEEFIKFAGPRYAEVLGYAKGRGITSLEAVIELINYALSNGRFLILPVDDDA